MTTTLIIIYIVSMILLTIAISIKNKSLELLAILLAILPIVNTALLLMFIKKLYEDYTIEKNKRKQSNKFYKLLHTKTY